MFRSTILALLCSLLVADRVGLSRGPASSPVFFLLLVIPLGLLGSQVLKQTRVEARVSWMRFWNLLTASLWLVVTVSALGSELQPIQGQGWSLAASWLTVMQPYAMTTSVFWGFLWVLDHHQRSQPGVGQVLALASPLVLLPLLLLNPAGASLFALPLVALAGVLRPSPDVGPASSDPRAQGLVALLEMLSSQAIAWGLWLASFGLLRELARGSYLEALFVAFSTGLSAWLGGGVIWGLSDALRRGRGEPWRGRLLGLLMGPQIEDASSLSTPTDS